MRAGLGRLKWPPDVFWSSSFAEFSAALEGLAEEVSGKPYAPPADRDWLESLMVACGEPEHELERVRAH